MNRKEFFTEIREISRSGEYYIFTEYKIGVEYSYEIRGNVIYVTLGKNTENKSHNTDFLEAKRAFEGKYVDTPIITELGTTDSLELLYSHYLWGIDNSSNSVMINNDGFIIGVQWNGQKNTSTIKSYCLKNEYIVLNNKKKLEGGYTLENIDEILSLCKTIFTT